MQFSLIPLTPLIFASLSAFENYFEFREWLSDPLDVGSAYWTFHIALKQPANNFPICPHMKRFWLMTTTFPPITDSWKNDLSYIATGDVSFAGLLHIVKNVLKKKEWQFGSTYVDQNFRNHQPYHKLCQTQFTTSETFSKPWKYTFFQLFSIGGNNMTITQNRFIWSTSIRL